MYIIHIFVLKFSLCCTLLSLVINLSFYLIKARLILGELFTLV